MNLNARSIINKTADLESLIITYKPHILIITETWLHCDIGDSEITPPGFKVYRKDRGSRGGGVAILFLESLRVVRLPDMDGLECVVVKAIFEELHIIIGAFYRPPSCDTFVEIFNEFLCSYGKHSSNMLLAGDFNFPSVDWQNDVPEALSAGSEPFVDCVVLHGLTQLVTTPTRVQNEAESVLDLFLVNNGIMRRNPQVEVFQGISDHKITCLTMQLNAPLQATKEQRLIPDFTRASDVDILDVLDSSFPEFVSMCGSKEYSIDHIWGFFKSVVFDTMNKFVPFRRKVLRQDNPWMNKEIVRMGRKLKKQRKQCKQRPSTAASDRMHDLRMQLKNKIKTAKEHYQQVSLKEFMISSPDKFWRYLAPKKNTVISLYVDDEPVYDSLDVADALNRYFCSVFTDDDGNIPQFPSFIEVPPISDVCVNEEGVFSLLLHLNVKKSPGVDGIPNAFLVRYAEWCAKYLCLLFNKSLECSELPEDWVYAKITPIPKGNENRSHLSSYRPISILSTCVKTLEHIIFKHISQFLESNCIVDARQHGFRRGRSTVTQLLETVHDFAATLDKRGQVDVIFLDFEKAFDRVSHSKLLSKLTAILKNETLVAWIKSYLSYRQQSVAVNGACSAASPVLSGVPQGSVLGPLFFLVFINDIVHDIPVKIKLFADDCVLYNEICNHNDQAVLNASLEKIQTWCTRWQMTLNYKKTVSMTITRKKAPLKHTYQINNHSLAEVSCFKYLGVLITSDLKWNEHVTYIQKKAMRKLGYLRRMLPKASQDTKLLAYKTYIRPLLEYASIIWDPYTLVNTNKLESIQRKAARFVYSSYSWKTSPTSLLRRAGLESLAVRRYHDRLKFFYLMYNDRLQIDKEAYIQPSICRPTRSNRPMKVAEFSCKTNVFKNSFFPRTCHEWNLLPANVVQCSDVSSFLRALLNSA